jgi:Holliday junction resolvase RusA-like endonuclease
MAKRRQRIKCALPQYRSDRGRWRRAILDTVRTSCEAGRVTWEEGQKLAVDVVFYMRGTKRILINDIDNRLKDVLDALQGKFAGKTHRKTRVIRNDNSVYRVLVEKRPVPKIYRNKKQDKAPGGRLVIRPYNKKPIH